MPEDSAVLVQYVLRSRKYCTCTGILYGRLPLAVHYSPDVRVKTTSHMMTATSEVIEQMLGNLTLDSAPTMANDSIIVAKNESYIHASLYANMTMGISCDVLVWEKKLDCGHAWEHFTGVSRDPTSESRFLQ